MMKNIKLSLVLFLGSALFLLACGLPSLFITTVETPAPESLGTTIFQTVAAAHTQTAQFLPSPTNSPTETLLPTSTLTETPTSTATVVFVIPTATRTRTMTPIATSTEDLSDEDWACRLVSRDPENGQVFDPRTDFDARWVIENAGKKIWGRDNVDYIYSSGTKMHKAATYDLPKEVDPGERVTILVDMITPRNDGTYSATWTLRSGQTEFCKLSLSIVVR